MSFELSWFHPVPSHFLRKEADSGRTRTAITRVSVPFNRQTLFNLITILIYRPFSAFMIICIFKLFYFPTAKPNRIKTNHQQPLAKEQ